MGESNSSIGEWGKAYIAGEAAMRDNGIHMCISLCTTRGQPGDKPVVVRLREEMTESHFPLKTWLDG